MTIIYYSPTDHEHHPKTHFIKGVPSQNREVPERAVHLLGAVRKSGFEVRAAKDFGIGPLRRIHTARYLHFLANAYDVWRELDGAADEIVPNAFPVGPNTCYPDSIVGRAGFHMADMACPINAATWGASYGSAQSALSAAQDLIDRDGRHVYALCRPPGHHAFADRASGYCFINNAAVVAQYLRDQGCKKVSILDIDVHHGNGTQEIFYDRGDVQTVSIHCDPAHYYPFFWGYPEQRGVADGLGANQNIPVEFGTGDRTYLETLAAAIGSVEQFSPDALVVSLGLDTFAGDPYAALMLTSECYEKIGGMIAKMAIPTVSLQEGGYICPELGHNLVQFLTGFDNNA